MWTWIFDIQETRNVHPEKYLSSPSRTLHDSPCTHAAGSPPPPPVRAIVFTSDSLSLIFNKPTHGEQNKTSQTDRMRERGPAWRSTTRTGSFSYRFSFSLRWRFRRSRRYVQRARPRCTHGCLFEQLIYNPRKYGRSHPRADRDGLRRNANNYASVLIAVIKPTWPTAGVGAHKSRTGEITYDASLSELLTDSFTRIATDHWLILPQRRLACRS